MITANIASKCSSLSRHALITLGCALSLAIIPVATLNAADPAPAASKAPSLPLAPKFTKAPAAEKGPIILTLTNTSKASIKASALVIQSVVVHNTPKNREIPAQSIEPGKTLTISELAAQDKVVVSADGFAPLEITVK